MTNTDSTKESFKVDANEIGTKLKDLIHEGNVRRINVKRGDDVIAEFPVTAAVVGIVLAPVLAAIGAIAAIVTNCTIEVERTDRKQSADGEDAPSAEPAPTPADVTETTASS